MKILVRDVHEVLKKGRIFVARGTTSIEETGVGFPPGAVMNIQSGIQIEPYTTFWARSGSTLVSMGAFSYTHSVLSPLITVGRYTSIAKGLRVFGTSHPTDWVSSSPTFYNHKTMMATYQSDRKVQLEATRYVANRQPINIGHDVWIGENVTLAKGIKIGNGAVIASNATVTKDVAPYTVVGGLPAKPIRMRFTDPVIDLLLQSEWWNYAPETFQGLNPQDPESFAISLIKDAESGNISNYKPPTLKYADFQALAAK